MFILLDYSANDMIGVEDNSYREIVTFLGPLGGPKGALRGSPKKKGSRKGGSKESGSSDQSKYTSVKIPKKKSFSSKFFRVQNPFKSMMLFTIHGDLIADLIK